MKNSFNNFFKTSDVEQIFFTTNFGDKAPESPVLVFNYGLVCSNYHWSKQIDFFDQLGFPILLHDYRGHYQSSGGHELDKVTFCQIASDLKELLDFLHIEKSIFLGHSMGVNVCLEFAKLYPQYLEQMILISGTIIPVHNIMMNTHLSGPMQPIFLKIIEKFPDEINAFWKYGGWNPLIKKLIHYGGFNMEQVNDEFIDIYLNKLGQLGPKLFFHLIGQMQEHDILASIHNLKTPTLIVGGNRDKVIPNYLQRLMLEKMPNSTLYLIHEGSHVPQVDFPEMINERMLFYIENKA